jgi:hypothetical protein
MFNVAAGATKNTATPHLAIAPRCDTTCDAIGDTTSGKADETGFVAGSVAGVAAGVPGFGAGELRRFGFSFFRTFGLFRTGH